MAIIRAYASRYWSQAERSWEAFSGGTLLRSNLAYDVVSRSQTVAPPISGCVLYLTRTWVWEGVACDPGHRGWRRTASPIRRPWPEQQTYTRKSIQHTSISAAKESLRTRS